MAKKPADGPGTGLTVPPPNVRGTRTETIYEHSLPEDCPDFGEVAAQGFNREFCRFYNLDYYSETRNLYGYKVGKDGLLELFIQYQARRRERLAQQSRRNKVYTVVGAALSAVALVTADQQFDLRGEAQGAWQNVLHPAPIAYTTYRPIPGIEHVQEDSEKNPLPADIQSWLNECHAAAYVLTECAGGKMGRGHCDTVSGRIYSVQMGECGEQFFPVGGFDNVWYDWEDAATGAVKSTDFAWVFATRSNVNYHPVAPGPAELCKGRGDGVFIAPVISDEEVNLPDQCFNREVSPLPRKGLFE